MATLTASPLSIVRDHQAEIWRFLRYLGCGDVEAEDLTQETFLAVLRRPFEDRGPIATAAYLRRVARNLFLKSIRRESRRPEVTTLDDLEEVWLSQCGRDGGDRYLEQLRECLGALDGRGRRVVDLRYGHNQSRGQIAADLGMSGDGVKSLLRRVRGILRRCVEGRIQS